MRAAFPPRRMLIQANSRPWVQLYPITIESNTGQFLPLAVLASVSGVLYKRAALDYAGRCESAEDEWMTEQEWLACTNPDQMLDFLREKASVRKLRLFGCACCRRIWPLLTDDRSRQGVEIAERFADGLITELDREKANGLAWWAHGDTYGPLVDYIRRTPEGHRDRKQFDSLMADTYAAEAAAWSGMVEVGWVVGIDNPCEAARLLASRVTAPAQQVIYGKALATAKGEETGQAHLLRDIFGSPFRPVTFDTAILHWNDGTLPKAAQAIYDNRRFDELPILAGDLEEAGCIGSRTS